MKPRSLFQVMLCLVLLPHVSSAITMLHGIEQESYAALGAQSAFDSFVEVSYNNSFGQSYGGGVMVSDNWLLTAAHVTWGSHQSGTVLVSANGQQYTASQVVYHPDWITSPQVGLTQGSDLALVRISTTATPFSLIRSSTPSTDTISITIGSGQAGTGYTGATEAAGDKLGAMNVIDRVLSTGTSGSLLVTDFDSGSSFFNSLNQPTVPTTHYDDGFPGLQNALIPTFDSLSAADFSSQPTALDLFENATDTFLEGSTAAGDSGGPLFTLNPTTGEWEVAGITSWGTNPLLENGADRQNSSYGDVAFYTSVWEHQSWINGIIPEPETYSLYFGIMALMFHLLRRPRTKG